MIPGEPDLPIYRGAKWAFRFVLEVVETGEPVDLTGTGPFVCEIKDIKADRILVTPTIISNYDAEGWFEVVISPEQTKSLPLGEVRIGVRDADFEPFLEWVAKVKWFTPAPH
jgi:hypothetical protein